MIEFQNVTFGYGEKILFDNFSLKIGQGERVYITGESGIGKTTFLRLVLGLCKPQKGSVHVDTDKFAVLFQENRLLPFRSVRDNMTLFSPMSKKDIENILSSLGISDAEKSYPSKLSGGMARRAALARALAAEGDILILDEPFNGLDEENVNAAAETINRYSKGKTLLLVSHDIEDAKKLGAERTISAAGFR